MSLYPSLFCFEQIYFRPVLIAATISEAFTACAYCTASASVAQLCTIGLGTLGSFYSANLLDKQTNKVEQTNKRQTDLSVSGQRSGDGQKPSVDYFRWTNGQITVLALGLLPAEGTDMSPESR